MNKSGNGAQEHTNMTRRNRGFTTEEDHARRRAEDDEKSVKGARRRPSAMIRSCVLHPTAVVLVLTMDFYQGSWMTWTDESLLTGIRRI